MARLQILELPTIYRDEGPDETPYILVIDQVDDETAADIARWPNDIATRTGARHVLCFSETIEIPANEVPLDPDGYPVKLRIEYDLETFRVQVQEEILHAQDQVTRAIRAVGAPEANGPKCRYCGADCSDARSWDGGDLYACPGCADGRAKLNQHKAAITDALGMDRTRDWDDIRNAAAGLRKERDAQAAAAQRVRDLHRPVEHRGQTICWACSDYDFPGQTTDSPPVAHDQCLTLKALAGYPASDA
jgi:hypothetical protein